MANDPQLDPELQRQFDAIAAGTKPGGGGVGGLINSYTSKSPYALQFKAAGAKYHIDPRVLEAIVQNESAKPGFIYGNPNAQGEIIGQGPDKGRRALGLMQLAPSTIARYGVTDPFNVDQNIDAAAHDLRDKLNVTDVDDYTKALNGYSGGGGDAYKNKFSNYYKALGGDPEALFNPAGPQPGAGNVLDTDPQIDTTLQGHFDALNADMQKIMASTSDDPRAETPVPGWGMAQQAANAALLNTFPNIIGALGAGQSMLAGKTPMEAASAYNALTQGLTQAKTEYEDVNKGHALMGNVLGETAGQAASISAGEGLLQAGGQLATKAFPILGKLAPVGRFIMGTAGRDAEGAAGLLARVGSRAASGARIGAESGAEQYFSEPDAGETLPESAGRGAITGAFTNVGLGPIVDDVKSPFRVKLNPQVAAAGKTLADAGIDIKGSQLAMKPGQAFAGNVTADQLGQHTGANIKMINPAANNSLVNKDFIKNETDRISNGMSSNTAGAIYDPQGQTKLAQIVGDARLELDQDNSDLKQIVKTVNRVDTEAGQYGFRLPPNVYRALTQSDGAVTDLQRSSSSLTRKYGNQLRDALDDMAERTALAAGPHGVQALQDLRTLREQYKRLQIVRGSYDKNTGLIDPQKLAAKVDSNYPGYDTLGVSNPFVELGRAGSILPPANRTGGLRADNPHRSWLTPIEKIIGLGAVGGDFLGGLHEGLAVLHEHPEKSIAAGLSAAGLFAAKHVRDAIANSSAYRNYLLERAGMGGKAPLSMRMMAGRQNMLIPMMNSSRIGQTYLTPEQDQNQ